MITCKVCKTEYKSALPDDMPNTNQGIDCATSVFEKNGTNYIMGSYGSDYDLMLYKFVEFVPEEFKNADPVCDKCFKYLTNYGFVIFVKDVICGEGI